MSDLISRTALLAEYDKRHVGAPGGARKLIEDALTIDAVPVVHGRWKLNRDGSGTCNQCHRTQLDVWDYDRWQNFCGCCGAKMDGE